MRSETSRIARHRGLRVLAAALGLADRLGGAVALGLELLGLGHEPPALGVHREHGRERTGAPRVARARSTASGSSRISLMSSTVPPPRPALPLREEA